MQRRRALAVAISAVLLTVACDRDGASLSLPAPVDPIAAALDRPCPPLPEPEILDALAPMRTAEVLPWTEHGPVTSWSEHAGVVAIAHRNGLVIDLDGATLLDVRDDTSAEVDGGLLAVAHGVDGTLLTLRTDLAGDVVLDRLAGGESTELFRSKREDRRHAGGALTVDDRTGDVYVGLGDGGGQGGSDLGGDDRGVVLRGRVTNEGLTPISDTDSLVWARGLRNPHRIWLDGDDLWIADVGERCREEVNRVPMEPRGYDFGWNRREGDLAFASSSADGTTEPLAVLDHENERCAVIGGTMGPATLGLSDGALVADFCAGHVYVVRADGSIGRLPIEIEDPISIGLSPNDTIWVATLDGRVLELTSPFIDGSDRNDEPVGSD